MSVVRCPLTGVASSVLSSLNSYSSLHHHHLFVNNVDASLWSDEALAGGVVDGGSCGVGVGEMSFKPLAHVRLDAHVLEVRSILCYEVATHHRPFGRTEIRCRVRCFARLGKDADSVLFALANHLQ